jgi:hypothetical protein
VAVWDLIAHSLDAEKNKIIYLKKKKRILLVCYPLILVVHSEVHEYFLVVVDFPNVHDRADQMIEFDLTNISHLKLDQLISSNLMIDFIYRISNTLN